MKSVTQKHKYERVPTFAFLSQLSLGWETAACGNYTLAIEIFRQIEMESMTPAPARVGIVALESVNEDAHTAMEKLWRLAASNPASCEAWLMLNAIAKRAGDTRTASQAQCCAEALSCGKGEPSDAFLQFLTAYTSAR